MTGLRPLPLPEDEVTTLVGTGPEAAALAAAVALSHHLGTEIVAGLLPPPGPRWVPFDAYSGDWVMWRGLLGEICTVAGLGDASLPAVHCLPALWGGETPPCRVGPEETRFWAAASDHDVDAAAEAAEASGRRRQAPLSVTVGYAGAGGDLPALYERLRGQTALVVEPYEPPYAAAYGPVYRFADMRAPGVREFLEAILARYADEEDPEPPPPEPEPPLDVYGLLEAWGLDAVRQLCSDGRSPESLRLKGLARERGLGPGALVRAAKKIAADVPPWPRVDGSPGLLYGFGAVFNQWRVVNSLLEGRYLQALASGAFTRTLAEGIPGREVLFQHGRDSRFGQRPLGELTLLEERPEGLYFEVPLLDEDHCWLLAPWLATGKYGCSIHYEVLRDAFVRKPGRSIHNPEGIPERTVREVRLQELGPVWPPAYRGTSCGVRSSATTHIGGLRK